MNVIPHNRFVNDGSADKENDTLPEKLNKKLKRMKITRENCEKGFCFSTLSKYRVNIVLGTL